MLDRPRIVTLTGGLMESSPPLDVLRPLADIVVADSPEALAQLLPSADILFIWDYRFAQLDSLLPRAPRLRWIQSASVGVEPVISPNLRSSDNIVLTNARGVLDTAMAEYVTGLLLASAKDLYGTMRLQESRQWRPRLTKKLQGQRAAVVGTGPIGRRIAAMLKSLDVEITLVGRRGGDDPDFGTIVPSDQLAAAAGQVDALILVAPLTQLTRGMVDGTVLAALGPAGYLINVGRGPLVVEADLVEALTSGQIAGAALDVVDTEPLPADSPLWRIPNLVISPHMSGDYEGFAPDLVDVFAVNLRRWLAGDPLNNIVDISLGYVASTPV
jgi:phosphoglycerate dehydrogenase-like enzyme